jgi:hypothetical protein
VSDPPAEHPRSLVERHLQKSLVDDSGVGKPLSRRARQTKRTVEAYLAAGVMPRYMERLREIDGAIATHRRRLERAARLPERGRLAPGEDVRQPVADPVGEASGALLQE